MRDDLVVYSGGTFDILHIGHVNFLRQCANLGEVIVSLNTDDFITKYKGTPPAYEYEERREHLLLCEFVSEVVPNVGGKDSKKAIIDVMPDIIAIGSDWARKDYYAQMGFDQDWLDDLDISLVYIPYTKGISTSGIRHRCSSRQ